MPNIIDRVMLTSLTNIMGRDFANTIIIGLDSLYKTKLLHKKSDYFKGFKPLIVDKYPYLRTAIHTQYTFLHNNHYGKFL